MTIGLLGKKMGMTQTFSEEGNVIPLTVIDGGPCVVVQIKGTQKDGYAAIQLGYGEGKRNRNRPMRGHFRKANCEPAQFLREFRISDASGIEVGQKITVEQFKEGDFVDITGVTKGKGFQGGVRRWGWAGGGGSHGSMSHRAPGSIGSNTTPGRVLRGHHLPGHMGNDRRTVQNLRIIQVRPQESLLVVQGSIPGAVNGLLEIRPAVKTPKARQPRKEEIKAEGPKKEKKPEKKEGPQKEVKQ